MYTWNSGIFIQKEFEIERTNKYKLSQPLKSSFFIVLVSKIIC